MKLSRRIRQIETSRTVRFTALIEHLRREGREIINFAVGEPEFDTPPAIIRAVKAALDTGATKYGQVSGIPALRDRLALGFDGYDAENILVANGSKQCLYALFQVICDPGDEVIIPSPYWVSFSQQVRLAGGTPVMVSTRNHQLDCDAIAEAITPETVAILVNSPNNPTGAVYPRTDLEFIARLARQHDLCLISDEAYEFLSMTASPIPAFLSCLTSGTASSSSKAFPKATA
ncbi:pyridoxal phosphate-dependent aminotransferase [Desulfonema ishimotonii]|uniref:Pyridoxal phosphate-dependent aminotransferase n=1 Tax=Desulfonema ishimotonii TaxID=45657 RepID=A0A401FWT0_9BACT|nr:aminotransferase class I/II-fold pyridoxal phosphate-dependent enzyme [Desulfonema ishimotonii]GBC61425.1 pyridoxal phosphate-dependent aminotransferase [Desulfonema ishimotonii]